VELFKLMLGRLLLPAIPPRRLQHLPTQAEFRFGTANLA
jgi:hypothetical protein